MTTFGEYRATYSSARDRTALLCTGLCRRHKPRTDFRETPWHGRAAACIRCETFPGPAGRSLWQVTQDARAQWELEQTRQKLRAYQRYVQILRLHRLINDIPRSSDVVRAHLRPWERVVEARRRKCAAAWGEALSEAHTRFEEER
ncbi:hypothetical protein [Streptomyces sp. NBC_01212]|uniref:hypothetical protein n=1 Tax=Streptomyces sp. NBC_01212 TaxID=2903775 RepID=UPI002E10792A|nr:hypothetical protein OG722_05035 [Streptomyces sp. NBC_01212]